jgi:hypothetical protein
METLTTALLIFTSFTLAVFLIYKGITGVRKTLKANK